MSRTPKRGAAERAGDRAGRAAPRPPAHAGQPVNYWEYIKVEELLALQTGVEGDEARLARDEVLFITVHQVYELWFKLILKELVHVRDLFKGERVAEQELSGAVHGLRRVVTVLRRCVDHFEVMETLPTREYLSFRDKLAPASGFQSAQLRQIEIVIGLADAQRLPYGVDESFLQALRAHDGSESSALRRVKAQQADRPTLVEAIDEWLWRTPIDGAGPRDKDAQAVLDRFVKRYLEAHASELERGRELALARARGAGDRKLLVERYEKEKQGVHAFLHPPEAEGGARRRRIRAAILFIATYRELPLLAWPRELLNALLETEQVFTIWRQRHARMVERVIGRRVGTGGSAGVEYLDQTALKYRVFGDLWAARTAQIRLAAAPRLERAEFYGFRNG